MTSLPAKMRAVQLRDYETGPQSIAIVEMLVPQPRPGEVLVQVFASPINPSDISFLRGLYAFKKPLPAVPGFEGSGTVVASGGGILARFLNGRRVACAVAEAGARGGMWAEYVVVSARRCVPLSRDVELEAGATMLVNPLMAWAMMDEVRRGGHRAIVQTAAASALGKMVVRLGQRFSVPVINVVRRTEQVEVLRGMGAEHVVDSSAGDFDERLRDLCHKLGATIGFDPVAGETSGRVLRAQPKGSRLVVYGALSDAPAQISPASLIFEEKQVEGLWLSAWMGNRNILSQLRVGRKVQRLLATDLKTEIQGRISLEEVKYGIDQYAANMTAGKVLVMPGLRDELERGKSVLQLD